MYDDPPVLPGHGLADKHATVLRASPSHGAGDINPSQNSWRAIARRRVRQRARLSPPMHPSYRYPLPMLLWLSTDLF